MPPHAVLLRSPLRASTHWSIWQSLDPGIRRCHLTVCRAASCAQGNAAAPALQGLVWISVGLSGTPPHVAVVRTMSRAPWPCDRTALASGSAHCNLARCCTRTNAPQSPQSVLRPPPPSSAAMVGSSAQLERKSDCGQERPLRASHSVATEESATCRLRSSRLRSCRWTGLSGAGRLRSRARCGTTIASLAPRARLEHAPPQAMRTVSPCQRAHAVVVPAMHAEGRGAHCGRNHVLVRPVCPHVANGQAHDEPCQWSRHEAGGAALRDARQTTAAHRRKCMLCTAFVAPIVRTHRWRPAPRGLVP